MNIKEQVIKDLVTGLTLTFKKETTGGTLLHITGGILPHKNRDFTFSPNGDCDGRGTSFEED